MSGNSTTAHKYMPTKSELFFRKKKANHSGKALSGTENNDLFAMGRGAMAPTQWAKTYGQRTRRRKVC